MRSRTALNGVILILAAHERTTLDVPIPETMNATLFADLFLNYLANLQMPSQQLKKKQMLWMIKIFFSLHHMKATKPHGLRKLYVF
jgi:hypothetical protein